MTWPLSISFCSGKISLVSSPVDVLLEINLDFLILPDLGLVVVRDDPALDCLWDGFFAAEPGHPILARAIENFVCGSLCPLGESVKSTFRLDMQSNFVPGFVESSVPGQVESRSLILMVRWMRAVLSVLLCLLVVLLLDFLTQCLVSQMSRHDAGAFRCSDVDRNLLVASTDLVTLESIQERTRWLKRNTGKGDQDTRGTNVDESIAMVVRIETASS